MVGANTSQGVVGHFITDLVTECRGVTNGNTKSSGVLAVFRGCLRDVRFRRCRGGPVHAGRGDPVGQAIVASNRTLKISSGSGMLLRVVSKWARQKERSRLRFELGFGPGE